MQTELAPSLPATLRLGAVHLTVSELDRSLRFYAEAIGLVEHRREHGVATLGAGGADLLVLREHPQAARPGRTAGLYHFALLFPSREELADAARRLAATATAIEGGADHGVSEAIYLPDPDGNGIELYRDRPRHEWPVPTQPGARVGMFTHALDLEGLLGLGAGREPPAHVGPGLAVGHVHLHVNDLAAARRFYVGVLGLEPMVDLPGAAFLAAGGYHHHLGVNVWRGEGIPAAPAPGAAIGLRHWTVVLAAHEVAAVRERVRSAGLPVGDHGDGFVVRDPAGIELLVTDATDEVA